MGGGETEGIEGSKPRNRKSSDEQQQAEQQEAGQREMVFDEGKGLSTGKQQYDQSSRHQ